MEENNLNAEDIENIITNVSGGIGDVCFPLEVKTNPRNIIDCQFSLPWTMACAAVSNKVGLVEFTDDLRKDEKILRLAKKVVLVVDENLTDEHAPASVSIKTKKGEFHKQGGAILGSPGNPLSTDAVNQKFRECADYGVKQLSGAEVDKLINTIGNLEKVDDVAVIPQMLG
jgi:2-methylcitrate dehydratase PrpD